MSTSSSPSALPAGMRRVPFGTTPDGDAVDRYTLTSASGVTITVLSYGGVIQSVFAPDRAGALADVTLGYDTLDGYLRDKSYLGALVGRYANRIRAGRFSLDGREYTLATNAGGNHLHGGIRGFNKVVWTARAVRRRRRHRVAARPRQPRRRRRLSGHADRSRHVRADRRRRARHRLLRHDRRADAGQPHPAQLLQSRWHRRRGHSRPRARGRGVAIHAGGCAAHPDGRAAAGAGHAVRFHARPKASARASTTTTSSSGSPAATITTS